MPSLEVVGEVPAPYLSHALELTRSHDGTIHEESEVDAYLARVGSVVNNDPTPRFLGRATLLRSRT